tara:strand:- start:2523 stop:2717 length:195 start_codon:yes stop_codon:yes gene_type:complete
MLFDNHLLDIFLKKLNREIDKIINRMLLKIKLIKSSKYEKFSIFIKRFLKPIKNSDDALKNKQI